MLYEKRKYTSTPAAASGDRRQKPSTAQRISTNGLRNSLQRKRTELLNALSLILKRQISSAGSHIGRDSAAATTKNGKVMTARGIRHQGLGGTGMVSSRRFS